MPPTFTSDRVQEVNATKGSCDARVHLIASSTKPHLRSATNVREYVALSELDQSKLKIVAVRQEVCGGARGLRSTQSWRIMWDASDGARGSYSPSKQCRPVPMRRSAS